MQRGIFGRKSMFHSLFISVLVNTDSVLILFEYPLTGAQCYSCAYLSCHICINEFKIQIDVLQLAVLYLHNYKVK